MKTRSLFLALAGLMVIMLTSTVWAQSPALKEFSRSAKQEPENWRDAPWRFNIKVYGWIPKAPVTIKADDITIANMPESFDNIFDSLDFAAMAEFEARKGPLGFFVSPIYYEGKDSEHFTGPLGERRKATLEERVWLVDYGVFYEIGRWPLGSNSDSPTVTVEPYAGFRYLHDNIGINVTPGPLGFGVSNHSTLEFNTPIVGLRTSWDLTDRWRVNVSGDYGGWDVDHVNETYQGVGTLGYRFTMWKKPATFFAGYRYLHVNYSKAVEIDVAIKGPIFGLGLEF